MKAFLRKITRCFLRPALTAARRLRNNLTPKVKNRALFLDAALRMENGWALMEAMAGLPGLELIYYAQAPRPERLPEGVRWCADRKSAVRAFYSSAYVFYSHAHLHRSYVPGNGQVTVNLWHGTPLKDISALQHGVFDESGAFSYVLSASEEVDGLMRRTFGCPSEKVLTLGYPKNDWLFTQRDVFSPLGIDRGAYRAAAIWMPTFRRSSALGRSDSDRDFPVVSPADVPTLNEALRERGILLIIKPHPAADALGLLPESVSHMRLITNADLAASGVQAYELLGRCDLLLTDYSSVYFDFLITGKPVLFVFDDLESYRDRLGFFYDDPLSIMPGPKAGCVAELLSGLDALLSGRDGYGKARGEICRRFNRYADADNRARLLARLGFAHE